MKRCALVFLFVSAVAFALASSLTGQSSKIPASDREQTLKKFLQTYLGDPNPDSEREWPTRYSSAFVDLDNDGVKEVIIYLSGRDWCGSGGCVMLILKPDNSTYRVVTKTTVTRLPIRVLRTRSNNWLDLSVVVRGGGIQPSYEAKLSFDGKTYPNNPSVSPSVPLNVEIPGRIVISPTAKDQFLYP